MKDKGFTLVELLIVMAIIGILIAIAIVGLGAAQADARNSARETAVKGMAGLLETYYGTNQTYPSGMQMNSAGHVEFYYWPSSNPYWATNSTLCKPIIVPSPASYSTSGCSGSYVDFCNPYTGYPDGSCSYSTTSSSTQYFYTPYTNGSPTTSNSSPVTGYLIGACLEGRTIFTYTSNGSNVPYKKTGPGSITVGGDSFSCQ